MKNNEASPKILLLDIETSPNIAYVWGKYEQDVIDYVKEGELLCYSAKWLNGKQVTKGLCDYKNKKNDKGIVLDLHKLMDEADVIVAHNGDQFDIKKIQSRFSFYKLPPPSPFKTVDTKKIAKAYFSFNSNKLDDLGEHLGLGRKLKHQGFELWLGCMAGESAAWKIMKEYNAVDVILLEKVYLHFLGWMGHHPNHGSFVNGEVCPKCGSTKLHSRGYVLTTTAKFRKCQCQNCGGWCRFKVKEEKLTTLANI